MKTRLSRHDEQMWRNLEKRIDLRKYGKDSKNMQITTLCNGNVEIFLGMKIFNGEVPFSCFRMRQKSKVVWCEAEIFPAGFSLFKSVVDYDLRISTLRKSLLKHPVSIKKSNCPPIASLLLVFESHNTLLMQSGRPLWETLAPVQYRARTRTSIRPRHG